MIISLIIDAILLLVTGIINVITTLIPDIQLGSELTTALNIIMTITTQGVNALYFIFGDIVTIIVPLLIILITFKYAVYPIVVIFRSIWVNSND